MIELHNRVVQLRRFGGPDELEVVDAPLPTVGRGEVRIRVLAASVEYLHRRDDPAPPLPVGSQPAAVRDGL
jgi:NADPH:quinone reductase-like Zn-dependent oxidoreductase